MADLTFNDYKSRISVIQVALELGYKLDKSRGMSQPSFVLTNSDNKEIDRIYIKHPNNNSIQGYWRRSLGTGKNTGDLIDFIKENLTQFPESMQAKNETQAVNFILSRLSNNPIDYKSNETLSMVKSLNRKDFDLNRYEREFDNIKAVISILSKRGLSEETAKTFLPFVEIVKDKDSKYDFKNLAFPYRIPGHENIIGYELRGYGSFKGKAEGSNSTDAVWAAEFNNNPTEVKNVYYAESGFDIMAFYQINKNNIDIKNSVFVSTGGSFSDNQFLNTQNYYRLSRPVLLFDNDIHGIMYDIRALAILKGKTLKSSVTNEAVNFTLDEKKFQIRHDELNFSTFSQMSGLRKNNTELEIWKAPSHVNDWNDVLLQKKNENEIVNKYDSNTLKIKR